VKRPIHVWPAALAFSLAALTPLASAACAPPPSAASREPAERSLVVTATAYNSHPDQTEDEPQVAAWGDWIAPGMKVIAVSRDLIELGLDHQTPVKIDGFPGEYVVLDKMHPRWSKRIDIYMGDDVEAARQWGARKVEIRW
jgi:3D (Asp-Asp-Asp) domain-containing protein